MKSRKLIGLFVTYFVVYSPSALAGTTLQELENRIVNLERRISGLESRQKELEAGSTNSTNNFLNTPFIGKWKNAESGESIELISDNSYMLNTMGTTLSGTWLVMSDGRAKINLNSFGVTQVMWANIDGNTLKIDMGGQMTIWSKMDK